VEPNIIPFIDVMLVLLIIFMVAAPLATVDVNVTLAPSEINPSKRPPKPVFISLQRDGKTYLGNDAVNTWDIPIKVGEAVKAANPLIANDDSLVYDQRVYVRADGGRAVSRRDARDEPRARRRLLQSRPCGRG
jgi:biopolymer transport protein ExbD